MELEKLTSQFRWDRPPAEQGLRVRFFTAADLVSQLEKAQKQYTLDRFLGQLERAHLLICDELGYVSLSRGGVELLFRVFGDRYERASVLITSNLAVRRMEPDLPGRADDRRRSWTVSRTAATFSR